MKNALITFGVILIGYHSFATCIVLVKAKDAILVAADSRSNSFNPLDQNSQVVASSICKIHNFKNTYFAVSGHGSYWLTDESSKALRSTTNTIKALNIFGEAMALRYQDLMRLEMEENKKDFEYYLSNSLAGVAFFGVTNNTPFLYKIVFLMTYKLNKLSVTFKITPEQFCCLGYSDHIRTLSDVQFNNMIDKKGRIYTLENLVKYEIQYHPEDIASPIDLLELGQNKVTWVRRKEQCN